jgi:diguanylate cyclase (GGDEF)-like protein
VDAINRGSVYRFFFKPWDDSVLLRAVHDGAVSCFTDRLLNALPDAQSRLLLAGSLSQATEAASAIFDAAGLSAGPGLEAAEPASGIVAASGLDALFNFTDPMGGDTVAASEKLRARCFNLIGLVVNDYHASVVRIGLEERLRLFSERDALSGLYNRRFFDENLRREFDRSRRYDSSFSLLMFDIDHVKFINDTYGHGAGDAVITGVGTLLLKELRSSDFACRYGGDEFCVIAPELSITQCEAFARRIAAAFASVGETGGFPCPVSLSIGVADYTPSDGEPEDVLRRADAAMYSVKKGGRNGVARAET